MSNAEYSKNLHVMKVKNAEYRELIVFDRQERQSRFPVVAAKNSEIQTLMEPRLVLLEKHFEYMFESQEKQFEARLAAQEKQFETRLAAQEAQITKLNAKIVVVG
jgi:hypothetical protein